MRERVSYEEYLEAHGSLTYTNVGVSMLPLLKEGRDLFTVEKKGEARCKVGDVVLYRRPPNQYVLHRIVEVRENDYVILGDNCVAKEYGIQDGDVLAVLTGYVRKGKAHSVADRSYRLYSWMILTLMPLRIFVKKCVLRLKSGVKKLLS